MMPPAIPMTSAATGPTKPEAGVMDARPADSPGDGADHARLAEFQSFDDDPDNSSRGGGDMGHGHGHACIAARFERTSCVDAEPPTHSMQAPAMVIHGACGGFTSSGKPMRGPSNTARTSAETPAVRCTT